MWLCHDNQALKNSHCFFWSLYGWKSCFLCWNKGLAFPAKKAVFFVTQQHSHELFQDQSIIKSRHGGMHEQLEDKSTMKTQVFYLAELSARWNFCLTSMCFPSLYCALAPGLLWLIQRIKRIKHLLAGRASWNIKCGLHQTKTATNQQSSLFLIFNVQHILHSSLQKRH